MLQECNTEHPNEDLENNANAVFESFQLMCLIKIKDYRMSLYDVWRLSLSQHIHHITPRLWELIHERIDLFKIN